MCVSKAFSPKHTSLGPENSYVFKNRKSSFLGVPSPELWVSFWCRQAVVVSSPVRAAATTSSQALCRRQHTLQGAGFSVLHKKRKKREDKHCAVERVGPREQSWGQLQVDLNLPGHLVSMATCHLHLEPVFIGPYSGQRPFGRYRDSQVDLFLSNYSCPVSREFPKTSLSHPLDPERAVCRSER